MSAMNRVALAVLGPALLAGAGIVAPTPAEAQTLTGTLLSMYRDRPIASGAVELLRAGDAEAVATAVSDHAGRFQITAPEPGIYIVRGLAPFHHAIVDGPVELEADATVVVQFRLTPNPVQLDPVEVEAEARNPRLERAGFYDRERQGIGHFITREEIERRDPFSTIQLFDRIPGTIVTDGGAGNRHVVFQSSALWRSLDVGGLCPPRIYLDGMFFGGGRMGPEVGPDRSIEEIFPGDIEAMEVYTRATRVPAQYGMDSECGVILIWLRR